MNEFTSHIGSWAKQAGEILKEGLSKTVQVEHKDNHSIVTEYDVKSEQFLIEQINKTFPGSSILAEESGKSTSESSELLWILDPLDGTTNYAHGFPYFCVSIAVLKAGEIFAGGIYQPILDELFLAEKGKGATMNGKPIQVSQTTELTNSLLGTGFYYTKGEQLAHEIEQFRIVCDHVRAVRRPGAAALDLAYLACGRYDGFWERGLSPWDVAAGFLLVEEAGGKLTDYKGELTDVYQKEVIATNTVIHDKLLGLFT